MTEVNARNDRERVRRRNRNRVEWNAAVSTRKIREKEKLKAYKCNELRRGRLRNIARADGGRRKTLRQFGGDPTCQRPKEKRIHEAILETSQLVSFPFMRNFSAVVRYSLCLDAIRCVRCTRLALSNGEFTSLNREQRTGLEKN